MRKVIDSNRLQSDELLRYLKASKNNLAVLIDFAAMEAYKGDTLVSIQKSMAIVGQFPEQIVVLKGSKTIGGLSGRAAGLQRRMIDEKQTANFPEYVRALRLAASGNERLKRELLEHGETAKNHLDKRMLLDAQNMGGIFNELANQYTKEEKAIIRTFGDYTKPMIEKLGTTLINLTGRVFLKNRDIARFPSYEHLPNTFFFRIVLCNYLMAIRWGAFGGVENATPERIRNDVVDMSFAAYATYFDDLMTADKKLQDLHQEARLLLVGLFDAQVPRLNKLLKREPR